MASSHKNAVDAAAPRAIVHRTRGNGHGSIVRLMSPSDLGEHLKPFVFLDLFAGDMRQLAAGMPLHPHSGIATITVFTDGDVRYDDPQAGTGTLGFGGVEWMRASGGVWHGKELTAGNSARMQGFQLWIALPPEVENGPVDSQYIEADQMPMVGPAYVILGRHEGVQSPVRAPEGLNYLLVRLAPGETWTYSPPVGHSVGWLAVAKGGLTASDPIVQGEMVLFERGEGAITLTADPDQGATFVLGSAVPHPHPLHLGYYSVHTTAAALAEGEARIQEIAERLRTEGAGKTASGNIPIFR